MPHSCSDSKSRYDNYDDEVNVNNDDDVNVNDDDDDDVVIDNDHYNSESNELLLLINYANKIIAISLRYLIILHAKMLFIFVLIFVVVLYTFFIYVFIKQITALF